MRSTVIAGNWKMNKTPEEAVQLAAEIRDLLEHTAGVRTIVCPPFTVLTQVRTVLSGSRIGLGAQDVFWEESGAYTGEVSIPMLRSAGCEYCIAGHSERRTLFGETDPDVNKKIKALLAAGMIPIACIGETLQERESGRASGTVAGQISRSFAGITREEFSGLIIAYEPVWAIGTGRTATPAQAQEMHAFIRGTIASASGQEAAENLVILYGGSVKPSNIRELVDQPDIDGALVGGASLSADSFAAIVKNVVE